MKKIVLVLTCAMMSLGAFAQVQFGAKVGFDLTNFWGENVGHKIRPNYQVGVLMEYKATPKFAIAPEVVFAAQGGKESITVTGTSKFEATQTYNTNYINIPIMLKYYVTPDFSIDFGPQLGINVYSKTTVKLSLRDKEVLPEGVTEKTTTDFKDATKAIDFGVGLGATYYLAENIFVQARYTMGLTKVFKEDYILDNSKYHNGNAQISFGMKF